MTDTARVLLGFVVAGLAFGVSALGLAAALVVVWAFLDSFIAGVLGVLALVFSPLLGHLAHVHSRVARLFVLTVGSKTGRGRASKSILDLGWETAKGGLD